MSFVTLEQKGPVGIITMNRPDALNALNEQVLRDLDAVLDQVEEREDILVAIVTGSRPLLRSRRGHRPDVHPHFRGGQEIRRLRQWGLSKAGNSDQAHPLRPSTALLLEAGVSCPCLRHPPRQ